MNNEYELLPELEILQSESYKENNTGQYVIIPVYLLTGSGSFVPGREVYYQSNGLYNQAGSQMQTYPQYPDDTLFPFDIIYFQFSTGSIPAYVDLNFRPFNGNYYFMKIRVPLIPLPQDSINAVLGAVGIENGKEQTRLLSKTLKKARYINGILQVLRGSAQNVVWGNMVAIDVQNGTSNMRVLQKNPVRTGFSNKKF